MYINGVVYLSFIIGAVCVFLIGRWLLAMSLSFVKDADYDRPWPFSMPYFPNAMSDTFVIFLMLCIAAAAVSAWPVTTLATIVTALLYSSRFVVRTGKKLGSLKGKSHDHPESVEQSPSKFSW